MTSSEIAENLLVFIMAVSQYVSLFSCCFRLHHGKHSFICIFSALNRLLRYSEKSIPSKSDFVSHSCDSEIISIILRKLSVCSVCLWSDQILTITWPGHLLAAAIGAYVLRCLFAHVVALMSRSSTISRSGLTCFLELMNFSTPQLQLVNWTKWRARPNASAKLLTRDLYKYQRV